MELTGSPNETDRKPMRNDVKHVHVKQYEMCISYCMTCTSRTSFLTDKKKEGQE